MIIIKKYGIHQNSIKIYKIVLKFIFTDDYSCYEYVFTNISLSEYKIKIYQF